MNAMILAAGHGTRLGELGRRVPKVLVEIGGEPLLARQIRYLKAGGIDRVVINAYHLAERIEDFVTAHPRSSYIHVIREPQLLGTAGGTRNALDLLGSSAFAVLYGDVIIDEPIAAVQDTHLKSQAAATLTVYRTPSVEGKGTVAFAPDGTVESFHEKTAAASDTELYVNAGLYIIDPGLLREYPAATPLDFGHDVFPDALAKGHKLTAHLLREPVIDMGTLAMLDVARNKLA